MSGLICKGNVQIALLDSNDTIAGYMGIKNTTELSLQPGTPTSKERISKLVANYGVAVGGVTGLKQLLQRAVRGDGID